MNLGELENVRALDHAAATARAELHADTQPVWAPLERILPPAECAGFMYMGRTSHAGTLIYLYKHGITRRYLNVSTDGQTWESSASGYGHVSRDVAIYNVFDELDHGGRFGDATRETSYNDDYRAGRNHALRAAGWQVLEV